jgi:hypothetical protein
MEIWPFVRRWLSAGEGCRAIAFGPSGKLRRDYAAQNWGPNARFLYARGRAELPGRLRVSYAEMW